LARGPDLRSPAKEGSLGHSLSIWRVRCVSRPGQENFKRTREEQAGHQVELVGRDLRAQMVWIDTSFQE